jgi:protein-tyrosine-phosphatase
MSEKKKPEVTESTATQFIMVRDKSGKEFVCRITDLKDPSQLTEEEKKRCYENIEDAMKEME